MRSIIGHPSTGRLRRWLDAAAPLDDAVTEHVGRCERCTDRLERIAELDGDGDEADPGDLSQAIRDIYAPPPDLARRIKDGISDRERTEREASLFLGLFSIAGDVTELMFPDRPARPPDQRDQHDQHDQHDQESTS